MTISLPYRSEKLSLELPDSWTVYFPKRIGAIPPAPEGEARTVGESLRNLINTKPLASQNLVGKRVVVIVDDNTRPTPAARFLNLVFDNWEQAGTDLKKAVLLTGLGIHTPMSEQEMISASIFCVNVVLNPEQRILASFAGDPIQCHRKTEPRIPLLNN